MAEDKAAALSTTGVLSRSPEEIARVLAMLLARGQAVRSSLAGGEIVFESRLLFLDPARAYILMESGAGEAALDALLARPRASFHSSPDSWHIEFAAARPQRTEHEGRPALRLAFPDILVTQQRRAYERAHFQPQVPLQFVADAGGPISFDGAMVDISPGGLGFLQYAPNITLEPGTVLKGCRIELPDRRPVTVDLEVRYSRMETLPDGGRAVRSGFRFVNSPPALLALLESFFKR
jgi:c-di-GMP-binding flagellar brake protein YcgR